ncbi:MAG: glycerophosphodiester phosphodiesterase [Bacteroidales bacterium]
MKIKILTLFVLVVALAGCNKDTTVPIPSSGPNSLMNETIPLPALSEPVMEGIYQVTTGSGFFGENVVLKWNRYGISLACNNGKYFVLKTGQLDSVILLQGYWRNGYSDETGLAALYIAREEGGSSIIAGTTSPNVIIRGGFGEKPGIVDQALVLKYLRPFSDKVKNAEFYILAHRSGGRTSDRLPVSENSIEMINFTERLGSNGIEVDVRLSSDGVVFLYHDPDINIRETKKGPLAGPIENYTWAQLSAFVRLIHGEKIPTLEDALNFVVDSTRLRFVYLDMKESSGAMAKVIPIQQRILARAQSKNRDLKVVVGIPSTDVLNDLMTYPGYQDIPSLCELTVDDVHKVNSAVWAPRWTLGTQNDLVLQMQSEGRLALCWTIDQVQWIREYLKTGHFDGLLTNYPYIVEYYHYIQ